MKTTLLALVLSTLLLMTCSDNDCTTCPDASVTPVQSFPIVGFWCADACEGQPMEGGMAHAVTLRRDGTYTECDSDTSSLTYHGTYQLCGDTLMLTPENAPHPCMATWICEISADSMTWRRRAIDINPAWVYLRSTSD